MTTQLALHGGTPVRTRLLPYGKQTIDDHDIANVVAILRSDWLTTGPKVREFEETLVQTTGAAQAVAISNGTAALHAAMYALNIQKGDEVLVPTMTFAASSNAVLYQGGTPIFVDVEPDSLLIDPHQLEAKITPRTKAIVAVDYAGQSCNYAVLRQITQKHGLALVADACHAIGGSYQGQPVGTLADLNTFSFHPVKHVTTGEGGAITTHDAALAQRMRVFRNHGITTDHHQRNQQGSWFYEMVDLGYNYRLTDFQCALGISQLQKLPQWITQRQAIAQRYGTAFASMPWLTPLQTQAEVSHAYHLYVVKLNLETLKVSRNEIFSALRAEGLGVNVHYIPVHLHPYYRETLGTKAGDCPVAEAMYERILSLPIFPTMTSQDEQDVITIMDKVLSYYAQ